MLEENFGGIVVKRLRVLVSLLLTVSFLCACPLPAFALEQDAVRLSLHKSFYNTAEALVEALLGGLSRLFPTPRDWEDEADVSLQEHMPGTVEWLSAPAKNARFSLGYDARSLLQTYEGNLRDLYVGGSIAFEDKRASELTDDLRVRTAALSDGSGRGTGVLLELDAYGLSLPDVREIRSRLRDICAEKNIHSITVAVLHQHSAVDTFGMNGNIFDMALGNPWRIGLHLPARNGKNRAYMEHLYETCCASVLSAVEAMTPGRLFYGTADQAPFLVDKRAPYVSDPHFNRFRFVPADGSRETWLVSTEIHCVGNGAGGRVITSDYPYYAERTIRQTSGANVLFFMGAQQSTSSNYDDRLLPGLIGTQSRLEAIPVFGEAIGQTLCAIEKETEIAPLFNVRFASVVLPISNPVLLLAGKAGMIGAAAVRTKGGAGVLTEIGYAELGTDLAFAIVPGELAPELAYGGCLGAADAWSGEDWTCPSLQEMVARAGSGRTLRVLDLANDQIGYIVPDNNYIPMIAPESNSIEFVSLGKHTASLLMKAYGDFIGQGVS